MPIITRIFFALFITYGISGCANSDNQPQAQPKNDTSKKMSADITQSVPDTKNGMFFYEPSVSTITGTICKKAVTFIANEEESTGPNDTVLVIALEKSISVINPPGTDTTDFDANPPNEYNVDTLQMELPSGHILDDAIGKKVQLKGTFFHSMNGHHFTDVLLTVQEITDEKGTRAMPAIQ